MRSICRSVLCLGMLAMATPVRAADPVEALFRHWEQTQRDARSLVVEFTLTTKNLMSGEQRQFQGTLQWMRTPDGETYAAADLRAVAGQAKRSERWSGLLRGRTVYVLDHQRKTAIKFKPTNSDVLHFLAKFGNPFVLLLDAKSARASCRVTIVKRDDWYTYLLLQPMPGARKGGQPEGFVEGRAVLMNQTTPHVPKDMPSQLWYSDAVTEYTIEIRRWRWNTAQALQPKAFDRPEDRPGWVVTEWPPKTKK